MSKLVICDNHEVKCNNWRCDFGKAINEGSVCGDCPLLYFSKIYCQEVIIPLISSEVGASLI